MKKKLARDELLAGSSPINPPTQNNPTHHADGGHERGTRRLVTDGSSVKRNRVAMKNENIAQSELTEHERTILAEDRERWQRMGAGGHLDDWLKYGPGQLIRRRLAMKLAHTDKQSGHLYTEAMSRLLESDGMHTMDKRSLNAVLWLYDNTEHLAVLQEIRRAMTPGERSRINSPITAQQRVRKELKERANELGNSPHPLPRTNWKQQLAEKQREIADLQERLAAAENDGTLFDPQKDKIDDIAAMICRSMPRTRIKSLRDQLSTWLTRCTSTKGSQVDQER